MKSAASKQSPHMTHAAIVITVMAVTAVMTGAVRATHRGQRDNPKLGETGMALLKGGPFLMGTPLPAQPHAQHKQHLDAGTQLLRPADGGRESEGGDDDERPVHRVTLSPFYIDTTEVTNAEFARFVQATGYKTDAERKGSSWLYKKGQKDWEAVTGADWQHPLGPDSGIGGLMDHPVVNVSWNDAAAYAKWAGKRLPTEAEWEYAARGGRAGEIYPWGNQLKPGGKAMANFWQGTWPGENKLEDGYYYTAPSGAFQSNGFGLCDMIGNVWEWTADWYGEHYYRHGPARDPRGPKTGEMRVARGGSWFCSEGYCGAYRVGFRGKSPQNSSFNNVGFRCAKDAR